MIIMIQTRNRLEHFHFATPGNGNVVDDVAIAIFASLQPSVSIKKLIKYLLFIFISRLIEWRLYRGLADVCLVCHFLPFRIWQSIRQWTDFRVPSICLCLGISFHWWPQKKDAARDFDIAQTQAQILNGVFARVWTKSRQFDNSHYYSYEFVAHSHQWRTARIMSVNINNSPSKAYGRIAHDTHTHTHTRSSKSKCRLNIHVNAVDDGDGRWRWWWCMPNWWSSWPI